MKIFDPIHGFIYFAPHEEQLINTYPFQRLRYIHQVGVAYLVFPGATHRRFDHSLGTMAVADQIFDIITSKRYIDNLCNKSLLVDSSEYGYWKNIVRLAALCHDLGHPPFSHTLEEVLLPHGGHERMTYNIIRSDFLKQVWQMAPQLEGRNIVDDVTKIALGEQKILSMGVDMSFSSWERVLSKIIIADYFGADRIDYLLRDAFFTGVSHGMIDHYQMVASLRILDNNDDIVLGVYVGGLQAVEALLVARYFMHARVYQHPVIRLYAYHLCNFARNFYPQGYFADDVMRFLRVTDNELLVDLHNVAFDENHPQYHEASRIIFRGHRYRCLTLRKDSLNSEEKKDRLECLMNELQKEFGKEKVTCDWQGAWCENMKMREEVLCCHEDGGIHSVNAYSQLIQHIPGFVEPICIFVSPELEGHVKKQLADFQVC